MTSKAERRSNRKLCNTIKAREPKPEPGVVQIRPAQPVERDGMMWLINKPKRLTDAQCRAARYYRSLYRDPGGPALPSSLDFSQARVDCGHSHNGGGIISNISHRQELAIIRAVALKSHQGMIDVLDEVCGKGRTLRDMAPDDREAGKLEERLKVALDLIAAHVGEGRIAA